MKRLGVVGPLVPAIAALVAIASAAGSPPVKTYVGQTDWQRAEQRMREQDWKSGRGRKPEAWMFQMKMVISSRGIETIEGMSGDCGSLTHHSLRTSLPAIPIRNGTFRTTYMWGRVTASKITGTFSIDGTQRCATKFTLTAGAKAVKAPPPKSPPTTTKPPPKEDDERELECKLPQVAAFVTSKGAVLRHEYGDKTPAGARAVCWPSVRAYVGGWKTTESYSGQNEWFSASEKEESAGSGTFRLSYAEVTGTGATAVYRSTAQIVGKVSGRNSAPDEVCTYSGSGAGRGSAAIRVEVGPPRKPYVRHQLDTSGVDFTQSVTCTGVEPRTFTMNVPSIPGLTTDWAPVRTWQALSGADSREGSGPYIQGGGMGPLVTTTAWSFKATG